MSIESISEEEAEETLADKLASKVAQAVENASEEVAVDSKTETGTDEVSTEPENLEETETYIHHVKKEIDDIPKEVMDLAIALHNILKAK